MVASVKVIGGGQSTNAPNNGVLDPRAAIDPSAEIGMGCSVGPFAVIGPHVRMGPGCMVYPHAVIEGPTVLGENNVVHSFACIGGPPQDLRYRGENTELVIGNDNQFREHVTINRGTPHGGGITSIGDNNMLMAYCHVAHDCTVGDHVIMANHATLAGHALIEDYVVFGGMVAVGTFLRIGESAMLAAGSMIEREVPPYCIVSGDRARLRAVNRVGLDRRNIESDAKKQIRAIFRGLKECGRPVAHIVNEFYNLETLTPQAMHMLEFIKQSNRGLTR